MLAGFGAEKSGCVFRNGDLAAGKAVDLIDGFITKLDCPTSRPVASAAPVPPPVGSSPVQSAPPVAPSGSSGPVKERLHKVCTSREQLIVEQKCDQSLTPLFASVVSGAEVEKMSTGYL